MLQGEYGSRLLAPSAGNVETWRGGVKMTAVELSVYPPIYKMDLAWVTIFRMFYY